MTDREEQARPEPGKIPSEPAPERPVVDLYDPFATFDFEPTDGGDF